MNRFSLFAFFLLTAISCVASSLFTVPPDCTGTSSCATTAGNSQAGQLFNDTTSTEVQLDFTAQMLFSAGCTGTCNLTSISFRLPSGSPAVGTATNLGNVDVFLSQVASAETNGHLSNTFATNVGGAQTEVFSGALSVGPTTSGTPQPFALTINFSTPYTYTFGASNDILFEILWTSSKTALGRNEDTTTDTTGLAPGFGTGFSLWGSGATGSGANSNEFVAQFAGSAIPEPGTLSLTALAALGLLFGNRILTRRS